jgi:hypothetical protein
MRNTVAQHSTASVRLTLPTSLKATGTHHLHQLEDIVPGGEQVAHCSILLILEGFIPLVDPVFHVLDVSRLQEP